MQKQQVFKVKGMQKDLSMANTNSEFACNIVNMRLLPAEEDSGLSLSNEKGALHLEGLAYNGLVIGQCATNDSLIFFTHSEEGIYRDYIYKLYEDVETGVWKLITLFNGDLNFNYPDFTHEEKVNAIETLFNYETLDIQKIYWVDSVNQLRCINIVESPENWGMIYNEATEDWEAGEHINNCYFDSVKEINTLPTVEIERVSSGSFTAGIIQYYVTYFNEFSVESPIVYTSPLLYIAHQNRGANVNDKVATAFKLTLKGLDTVNWNHIKIYSTHRTSLDATPEGSVVAEIKIPKNEGKESIVEFIDYGGNRISISPTDLYFIGGKFVKAGTMTAKDQVLFLGNLDIQTSDTVEYTAIKDLFDRLRESGEISRFFSTKTRKQIANDLSEYEETYYTYNNQLNNTKSITHYKYGEKYRFGISVMDKYGVWSNPIWIMDEFILTPPAQINTEILELPCPSLYLSEVLYDEKNDPTLLEYLQSKGAKSIKPLVVFPNEEERKVIAQGIVCPTVYNLKDRKENGPYAQASWFMRPNVPADLWGIRSSAFGKTNMVLAAVNDRLVTATISHKSDVMTFPLLPRTGNPRGDEDYEYKIADQYAGYYGAASTNDLGNEMSGYDYLYDDFSATKISADTDEVNWNSKVFPFKTNPFSYAIESSEEILSDLSSEDQKDTYTKGSWLEFRHNYALRSKGWSFGYPSNDSWNSWYFTKYDSDPYQAYPIYYNLGMVRGAELDTSRFDAIPPVNRFIKNSSLSDKDPILLDSAYVKGHKDDLYFVTIESPKSVHKKRQEEKDVFVLALFVYTDQETKIEYVHIIEAIKIPTKATIGTLPTVYGSPNVFINLSNSVLNPKESHQKFLKLKAKAASSITEFKNGERNYYVWKVRDVSGIKKEDYIENYMPVTTLYLLNSEDSMLRFGSKAASDFSLGNASYYVDNSIVTLNSPEVELRNFSLRTDDSKFRITGLIPLTATSSDVSLEVESPSLDSFSLGVGLTKRTYHNTNIGYHGFKGIVGSNAYLTSTDGDTSYSLVPLQPWHTTGTLGKHDNTSDAFKSKDILKKKVLSNLRYSASTYFFNPNTLQFADTKNNSNKAFLKENIIGWTPSSVCDIQVFNSEDTSTIIKLNNLNYTTQSLVYKGNIDSIAMLVDGNTDIPLVNPIYSFRDNPLAIQTDLDPLLRMDSPAVGSYSLKEGKCFYKEAQGASIKYKSSPHFVIGFSCLSPLWGSNQRIQETLPAWRYLNEEGIAEMAYPGTGLVHGQLYEDSNISSLYHQDYIYLNYDESMNSKDEIYNLFRSTPVSIGNSETLDVATPNFGWLWLGEIYRDADPTFGGTSQFALENNMWQNADNENIKWTPKKELVEFSIPEDAIPIQLSNPLVLTVLSAMCGYNVTEAYLNGFYLSFLGDFGLSITVKTAVEVGMPVVVYIAGKATSFSPISPDELDYEQVITVKYCLPGTFQNREYAGKIVITKYPNDSLVANCVLFGFGALTFPLQYTTRTIEERPYLEWTTGDTYYQRFDTLKTYAHDDAAQNSIIDITSFMVETRINIDGRYDRNRGQESNLQMSPTNFNLINDTYSQEDNFFTYRILDDNIQARTKFPNQITWSLSKNAGETIDSWMNVTLASVLDLDGGEGQLTALKVFNNSIVAFQETGISQILFNSRVQIPTSEMVPIQIANSGKVDGQQFISRDIGCQYKYSIATSPLGLYFVDHSKKALYRFNGQLEDLSTSKGFRGYFNSNIDNHNTCILTYDDANKELMLYNPNWYWLDFSELTNTFSSFYTYPYAKLSKIKDKSIWLNEGEIFLHNEGEYNDLSLLAADDRLLHGYGLEVNVRQDSNIIKVFNNVEFRADSFDINGYNESILPFNAISAETEYQDKTIEELIYNQYRPSNLKKKLRTWRANIPRVNSRYNRFVNQWAKISLWKMNPSTEKTILHDLSVWYSE